MSEAAARGSRRRRFSAEAPQPHLVDHQQMLEGGVDRFEEGRKIGLAPLVRELRRRGVQLLVHPTVVVRKQLLLVSGEHSSGNSAHLPTCPAPFRGLAPADCASRLLLRTALISGAPAMSLPMAKARLA